ncbi:prepilin peptidase [Streptomyces cyanogenus]|uniref:prepilin peptidase n=1 Tax=Streptomyces cyanogenus TaxID=80860 RepID=UPI001AA0F05A|nr:A24 family peptidase [Streptomyces cyanogenus]
MTTGVLVLVAAVWGALTGTLLPRAAYRFAVPSGEPWRDRCPGGHHPVRGWLGGARCGECAKAGERGGAKGRSGERVGDQGGSGERAGGQGRVPVMSYRPHAPSALLLATVGALVCAALAAATGTRPELAVWLLLAPVGVLLAAVDLRVQRLPDPLTLPLAAAALALLGLAALLPEHAGHWRTALYGALALGAGYYALYRLNPGGMGFGDVKLAVGMGAVLGWYGWPTVLLGTFAGFLLGALYGGALVLARRANRKTAVPFGPFLLAGALAGLLIGAYAA